LVGGGKTLSESLSQTADSLIIHSYNSFKNSVLFGTIFIGKTLKQTNVRLKFN